MAQFSRTEPTHGLAQAGPRHTLRAILRRQILPVLRHLLLITVTVALLAPFYWMTISALKTNSQVFAHPVQWWPDPPRWDNFTRALNYPGFPFLRFFGNSLFYAGSVAVGTVISCAAVGYGFARLRFPGRDALFVITMATLMIPPIVTFIPTYALFKGLGLVGTYTPLILPRFLGSAFFIFMMRQFFLGVPWELSDAARVDGAGEWRIFWQIMLPLVRSALMVVAVFAFLWTWHEFFLPLIYLSERSQYPLSLGLFTFRAQRTTEWSLMMAASLMTTLPLVVIFFFTQRYFLQGVTLTGMKG
jgi:ABC-type glycerol-3-phosphate transport system permease component